MDNTVCRIAIVGLGPKGLYAFERLLAQLEANPVEKKVEIHLFNKTDFMGSGDVYRSDQPDYLLMNFANEFINLWPKDSPSPVVDYPFNLSEFLAKKQQKSIVKIDSLYASRATVGEYLENGYTQLCQKLPDNVILHEHISEVQSIEKTEGSYSIGFLQQEKSCRLDDFQYILISTGHPRHKENTSRNKVSFIYPVDEKLNGIHEKNTVAIKGMGLTFIDAALALTEGKEGFFTEREDGTLIYTASGKEPKRIFPFSKSGWLMLPKYNFKDDHKLYVERLNSFQHQKLSFKNDILPLLVQDMEFAYYRTLFLHDNEVLTYHSNYEKVSSQINAFHQNHPGYEPFSIKHLLEPEFDSTKSLHQNTLEMLSAFTIDDSRQIVHKAQLAAAAIWKKVSPVFNDIYSFNGLDVASHEEFDNYYFGKLNRIAFGPPPANLKKILALANAGILDFRFAKNPQVTHHENGYWLKNNVSELYCDILIDARIPKNSIDKEASGLFKNLCENKLARPYVNREKTMCYAPGIVEINSKGKLINPQGHPEDITLYGTPTEGLVHDNDTLSRTRNNFAGPWAREVIQQLMNTENEFNQRTSKTFAGTK